MRLDENVRVQTPCRIARALHLCGPDSGRIVNDLALQVVERDAVVIDDADGSDARRS